MIATEISSRHYDWKPLVLAIVLMLTGAILVVGDALGILSLDRVQNYWPLAVIAVGAADLICEPTQSAPTQEKHVRQLWQ